MIPMRLPGSPATAAGCPFSEGFRDISQLMKNAFISTRKMTLLIDSFMLHFPILFIEERF
jgi:hypothetical protein